MANSKFHGSNEANDENNHNGLSGRLDANGKSLQHLPKASPCDLILRQDGEQLHQLDPGASIQLQLDNSVNHPSFQFNQLNRECLSQPQQMSFINASSVTSAANLLDNLNDNSTFDPKDHNFSDLQEIWIRKGWLDILFRVASVVPIVLLGIFGNLVIIYSMYRFKPIRLPPRNVFILNMAIADLLTTLVCPMAALLSQIYQFYILGSFICRFEGFVKITCLLVSSYSLIVLSSEWLLCVVQPCRQRITVRQSWLALATIWVGSVLMASPLFVLRSLRHRQWKDLVEVWCCEQIQYTKYYWVVIIFFLIYLPTFFMTIVLVVILDKLGNFEAKLRRSVQMKTPNQPNGSSVSGSGANKQHNQSRNTSENHKQGKSSAEQLPSIQQSVQTSNETSINQLGHQPASHQQNSSSMAIKYKRRIAKILFTYLLTSIICWTPWQLCTIYRHFRSEAIPSSWYFELLFWSQLLASLTAAMNPIIFGFLSQPFRQIVTKSWVFKFLKGVASSARPSNGQDRQQQQPRNNKKPEQMQRVAVANKQQQPNNELIHQANHHRPMSRRSIRQAANPSQQQQQQQARRSRAQSRATSSRQRTGCSCSNQQPDQLQQPNKRVAFIHGRENAAFERTEFSLAPEVVAEAQRSDCVDVTTFMEQRQNPVGFVSAVSMDSINIEENLQAASSLAANGNANTQTPTPIEELNIVSIGDINNDKNN